MTSPPLVNYDAVWKYREHYENVYCRKPILTFDGISVWFRKQQFNHVFFKSTQRDDNKDTFSNIRAQRIDWIKATLQNPDAELYCGWDKYKKKCDPTSRVNIAYGDYVVIIQFTKRQNGTMKCKFKTAYLADESIGKIKKMPRWKAEMM